MEPSPGVSLDKTAADRGAEFGETLVEPDEIVIHDPSIQVLINMPLQHSTVVTLHGDVPGGFTRRHLLESLQAEYSRMYAEEEAVGPVPGRTGRVLFNRWALCRDCCIVQGAVHTLPPALHHTTCTAPHRNASVHRF